MAGPLLSVSSDFLFHVSSTLPLSFHYPCCLFVLVPRSSETTGRDALVLLDRFPFPQENGQPTVSPVVVCRVVLSDRRARRQTKEGMLDQRLIRSRKCRREKFLGIPFCFNRSRDVYRFRGRTRFDLGWLEAFYNRRTEESEGWSLEGLFFFFFLIRVLFIFFVSSSFELLLSSLQKEFVFAQCTQVERNVCQDSDITVNKRHPNFFPLNLYE